MMKKVLSLVIVFLIATSLAACGSEKAVYEGDDIQTSSFTVTNHESGMYIIRWDANNHCGR